MQQTAEGIEAGTLRIVDCGLADYREVLGLQNQLHAERLSGLIPDTVVIVEHPPVITLGARASANKLLVKPEELRTRHIDAVETRRGGGATAHNPGQLVLYPILNLRQLDLGIGEYIRTLETIGIELLAQLSVAARRREGFPGLWVAESSFPDTLEVEHRATSDERRATRKIASIGVRVSKGVTYHGMAINIQNDLSIFDLIVPCGLAGVEMTSVLKETSVRHNMDSVKEKLKTLLVAFLSPGDRESNIKQQISKPHCKMQKAL